MKKVIRMLIMMTFFGISSDATKYDSMNTAHAIADNLKW